MHNEFLENNTQGQQLTFVWQVKRNDLNLAASHKLYFPSIFNEPPTLPERSLGKQTTGSIKI